MKNNEFSPEDITGDAKNGWFFRKFIRTHAGLTTLEARKMPLTGEFGGRNWPDKHQALRDLDLGLYSAGSYADD